MSVSTDGQICFGIRFDEDMEFAWDASPYDGDIDDWFAYAVGGFKHSFEIYNKDGDYLNGIKPSDEQATAYWHELWDFKKEHPCPVEKVNYCSDNYPMWILTKKGNLISNSRGFPVQIKPSDLLGMANDADMLVEFCKAHNIDMGNQQPTWWLSSYWG